MQKMTIKDDFPQIKLIFSELHKKNSEGEYEVPFLFNFISVKRFYLMIHKNRNGKYLLLGKMPYKVNYQSPGYDRFTDCFYGSDKLEEVQEQFYILSEKLLSLYRKKS